MPEVFLNQKQISEIAKQAILSVDKTITHGIIVEEIVLDGTCRLHNLLNRENWNLIMRDINFQIKKTDMDFDDKDHGRFYDLTPTFGMHVYNKSTVKEFCETIYEFYLECK